MYHAEGSGGPWTEEPGLTDRHFVPVARVQDVPPGSVIIATAGRDRVALANVDGEVFAIDTACSHVGASLAKGKLEGHLLECPLHCSQFDVRSGRPRNPPAIDAVRTYPVRIEAGAILIGVIE